MADKGPLQAVATARELGIRILLAGQRNDYYHEHIEPLVDGRTVEYVGYVTGADKDTLLGGARALLYPIQDPEPFGLVLIEAMMCGTPVVAMRLGAVPEIVEEGVTGYYARSTLDFPAQALRSIRLDRNRIREHAQMRFSVGRMALAYESLYEGLTIREPVAAPRVMGQGL
jgi:glycosyltransferase involved in cell wall biosynthesis